MNNKGCCVSASRLANSDRITVSVSGDSDSIANCVTALLAALLRDGFESYELAAMCMAATVYARDHDDF